MHFHDNCFVCVGCDKQLGNISFIYKDEKFTCAECYENKFSPKCATCEKTFKAGQNKMFENYQKYQRNI